MTKQNKGRKLFAVSASAALVASAIVPVASANADFTDASSISEYAQTAVEYFVGQEVINGYEDGSFKPKASVKRGEAAKMFTTGLGLDTDVESDLTDIAGHWAEEFINAVAAEGIVNGYEDGSFQPEKTLSRAETAKMIVEALQIEEEGDISDFTDVAGHWSEDYIVAAVGAGVLTGKTTTTMDPDGPVTREQFAAMLYRAFDYAGLIEGEEEDEVAAALAALAQAKADLEEFGEITEENYEEAQALLDALNEAIAALEELDLEDNEEALEALEEAQTLADETAATIEELTGEDEPTLEEQLAAAKADLVAAATAAAAITTVDASNVEAAQEALDTLNAALEALNALVEENEIELDEEQAAQLATAEALAAALAAKVEAAQETPPTEDTAKVVSVTAVNKTTVEVKLSVAVDAVTAENFTIEGGKVNSAKLSDDKKSVTLNVSDLAYDKDYKVVVKDIKVNGEATDFGTATFKTPGVTDLWTLEVVPTASTVTANGADNTVVTFKLLNAAGEVDTAADNIVLAIDATFGNLANTRVTVQDGVGQVVLSSEFSTTALTSKIKAQIIEASGDYKDLIGKVAGEGTVNFVPSGAVTDVNAITFLDAESNQADRVVLYFDKPVSPATFAKVDKETGDFEVEDTTAGYIAEEKQVSKDGVNIVVSQNANYNNPVRILGYKSVEGNANAIEVILDKSTTLKDNAKVYVKAALGTTNNEKSFTLTDARQPEVTSVTPEGLRTLKLKFSEAVYEGTIKIDGIYEEGSDFTVEYGDFDPATAVDYRDVATVKLGKYLNGRPGTTATNLNQQRYFSAGSHSVAVTQLADFAGSPQGQDTANVSTSQTLTFNIVADTTAPNAKVSVESPEQFRITFDKDIEVVGNINQIIRDAFEIYDATQGKYVKTNSISNVFGTQPNFVVTQPDAEKAEFVVELDKDWSKLLSKASDSYSNYKFQFNFGKDIFTNATNGVKNSAFTLDLNYTGSALNTVDNVSPVISAINATKNDNVFNVVMSEPVKLNAPHADNAGNTENTQQGFLPQVQVEFQGKDKSGKVVVIPGTVSGYSNKNGDDTAFTVTTNYADANGPQTLQSLVNAGYSETWKVVVKSISDDVGNTAATVTQDFTVKAETNLSSFYILSSENTIAGNVVPNKVNAFDYVTADNKPDRIEVSFSKAVVHTGGQNDLTNVANWTLNGQALSNVASITVANRDNIAGNETVIITFKDANALKATSNVIAVNKNILSADGTALIGEYEVVANTQSGTLLEQQAAFANLQAVIASIPTDLTVYTTATVNALNSAKSAADLITVNDSVSAINSAATALQTAINNLQTLAAADAALVQQATNTVNSVSAAILAAAEYNVSTTAVVAARNAVQAELAKDPIVPADLQTDLTALETALDNLQAAINAVVGTVAADNSAVAGSVLLTGVTLGTDPLEFTQVEDKVVVSGKLANVSDINLATPLFPAAEKAGYFFAFELTAPTGITVAANDPVQVKINGATTWKSGSADGANQLFHIQRYADAAALNGATSFTIEVDWDMDGTADAKYTFDISGVTAE